MAKKSPAKAPATVAERRKAIRAAKGEAIGPGLKKAEIDLTKPAARKMLAALYPRPTSEAYLDATPETEAAALAYIEQRDAESVAKNKKEVAGNVLCNVIGEAKGIRGVGWKATWDMSMGNVDWEKVCADFNITVAVLEKYRKADSRGLDVRELAESDA